MTLFITRTFQETTPESAEIGEFSDHGFIETDTPYTFRELVDKLKECCHLSSTPHDDCYFVWASTEAYCTDYGTGTYRTENVHFSRNNPVKNRKYWPKALRAAGLI